MFVCESCGEQVPSGVKQHKKVIQTRKKVYTNGKKVTTGYETVREIGVCPKCSCGGK